MPVKSPPAPPCVPSRKQHRWRPWRTSAGHLDPQREQCRECGTLRVFGNSGRRVVRYEAAMARRAL